MKIFIIFVIVAFLLSGCVTSSNKTSPRVTASNQTERPQTNHIALQKEFPKSAVMAYNAVLSHLAKGDRKAAEKLYRQSRQKFPKFSRWSTLYVNFDTPDVNFGTPEEKIGNWVNQRLSDYLAGASETVRFTGKEPTRRKAPPLPTLVKGEYEKTVDFKKRVAQAEAERKAIIQSIEDDYVRDMNAYNQSVEDYNAALKAEVDRRKAGIPAKRHEYLTQAVSEIYGNPKITKLEYNADKEVFNAVLDGSKERFSDNLEIHVPIDKAPDFKQTYLNASPVVLMTLKNNRLMVEAIEVENGVKYAAHFGQGETAQTMQVTLNEVNLSVPQIDKLKIQKTAGVNESKYFMDALSLENNPELAKVKQREAEVARKTQEAKLAKQQQQELIKRKEQVTLAELELAKLRGDDSYLGLTAKTAWQFKPAKKNKKDLIAVVIGNRKYEKGIPPVHYALNDAKAMRQFLEEGMGVDPTNILYRENATKGHMEALFESELPNRVKSAGGNADVFVYFSGHGFPDKTNAVLLPSDALPGTATVSGYSRDRLIGVLAKLDAKSVTVALDACFTGTAKNGNGILKNAKAQFRAPKSTQVPKNMMLISASKADQVSWGNDTIGHSVMTYFLLKGLNGEADNNKDGNVNPKELDVYLKKNVNAFALKEHNRAQEPEITFGAKSAAFEF